LIVAIEYHVIRHCSWPESAKQKQLNNGIFPLFSSVRHCLVGNTNNTTSRSGTSVTSLERLLAVTLAKVVSTSVDNNGSANDAVRANQLDKRVSDGALGIALGVSLDVSEITNVTGLVRRSTVGLVVRVDYGRAS
jgi:hypothetical protein